MTKDIEPRLIEAIDIDSIHVSERMRPLDEKAVEALAESIDRIGMQTPIHYRLMDCVPIDGMPWDGVPVLVAGAHRLAAAKRFGWTTIDAIEVEPPALEHQAEDECPENDVDRRSPTSFDRRARARHEHYMLIHDQLCTLCVNLHVVEMPSHFDAQLLEVLKKELADAIKAIEALRSRLPAA